VCSAGTCNADSSGGNGTVTCQLNLGGTGGSCICSPRTDTDANCPQGCGQKLGCGQTCSKGPSVTACGAANVCTGTALATSGECGTGNLCHGENGADHPTDNECCTCGPNDCGNASVCGGACLTCPVNPGGTLNNENQCKNVGGVNKCVC